jgi:hypothetical protein
MPDLKAVKKELTQQFLTRFADVFYVLGLDDPEYQKAEAKKAVKKAEDRAEDGTEKALRNAFKAQMQDEIDEARETVQKVFGAAAAREATPRPPSYEVVRAPDQPRQYTVSSSGGPRFL